jgi:ActR/RegA family two-component response regulator
MSSPRRVLLVDDDPLVLRTTSRWLRRRGFDVVSVSTGEGALATVGPFACAVFDLELPDGSGVDFAGKLVASGAAKAVVFFSGTSNTSLLTQAGSVGQVVPKGAGIGELAIAITEAAKDVKPSGIRVAGTAIHAAAGAKD